jgi:trans-aconitate 2-methyltransferase
MIPPTRIAIRGRSTHLAGLQCYGQVQRPAREQRIYTWAYISTTRNFGSKQTASPRTLAALSNSAPPIATFTRTMATSQSTTTSPTPQSKDWSATQYLKFSNERTRPVHDLIAQVAPHLSSKPNPLITGVDASADMLAKARATLPDVPFLQADLSTFSPGEAEAEEGGEAEGEIDLLFSNAVFHWLRTPARLNTLTTLFSRLKPGGILAFQMPDNYTQPSHAQMRAVASQPNKPWSPFFSTTAIGELVDKERPDLDPIEPLAEYYNALSPLGKVDMWHTTYAHVVADAAAIVEWVKGSGLQPFLQRIGEEGARKAFLEAYEGSLKEGYPVMRDGKVVLKYPRLFVVAVRQ